jgi:hypothetical protein
MNLGVVTPQLNHYRGSEVYLLECLRRWQDAHQPLERCGRCVSVISRSFLWFVLGGG